MALRKPQMVLLDVDGTLVDTAPDLAYSIDCMLQEIGLPERGEEKVRTWIGNGIEQLVKCALTDGINGERENGLYEIAYPIFLNIYTVNACKRSRVYPGVEEGLNYLKENDFKLGCVTNKRKQFTEMVLKTLGIFNDFGIVIAGDTLPRKKPDPMPLLHAAEFFSVKPEAALMVGDSRNDVSAARAAGFQIVCVSYGYSPGEDIRCANPDAVVDSLAELPVLLNT
ncbi:MAG: phosphoglycolate phosphatase [Gammaproteobacteria bacterium]|nr:phosphoglycolate phosphatase [Gammaproteobacteria bacterium]